MTEKKKKSLVDAAIDALTDRDEKAAEAKKAAAIAAAQKAADERAKAAQAAAAKGAADRATAAKAAAERSAAFQKAAAEKAAQPKKGVVYVKSLRIRKDHNTKSEMVDGLVAGDEVTILETWVDGEDIWAKLGP